jgi:hypothetical protein
MTSKFQFLNPDNLVETFRASQQYTEALTDNFFEYERLMRNKPHANIPKEYPKTTDGTTASIIRKTPHRIIQQLPTGKVVSDTNDWLSIVAGFIYTDKIIPNANEGYALLQKCWSVVERFMGFGSCPTYVPFNQHNGYFCTDLRLPYWGDMFLQPGKISDEDSNYIFMRSWWQTKDIEALIAAQEGIDSKNRTWDVEALKAVKEIETTKDEKAKTPAEREKSINSKGGVELITGFQRGVKANFYTFHVQSTGTGSKTTYTGTIVRTKQNKDPRGEIPVSYAYGDIDGSNPLGRSVIELVGGIQNLLDGEMQMYQYNRALQLNPPLIKRGSWNKNKIKFAPNTVIDMGAGDPNVNSLEPLKIDSTALANFPANYQLMQSQMFQLLATPNSTISSEVGSISQSKTPQGVEANKLNLSIDDNYVRKQFETWFERWSETAINLYFAERSGIEEVQLDEETANVLKQLAADGKFDLDLLSEDNKIRIDYDSATEQLKFRVDPSTSKKQDDAEQLALIQQALQTVTPQVGYYMGQDGWKFNLGEAYRTLLSKLGIENIDRIVTRMNDQEAQQAKQAPFPIVDPPQIRLNSADLSPAALVAALQAGGINVGDPQAAGAPSNQAQLDYQVEMMKAQATSNQPEAPQQDPNQMTPDHVLKAHDQAHKQSMDEAKLELEAQKMQQQGQQQAVQTELQAKQADQSHELAVKQANKPQPKPTGANRGK